MANYTRLTNLEVTGDLKTKGTVTIDLSDVTRPATAASTAYTKDEITAIVNAVNGILTALGKPVS